MLDFHELYGIDVFGALPLDVCIISKPYLLDRASITKDGSVLLFLLPYYTHGGEGGNVSMYAAAEDYHAYCRDLFDDVCSRLSRLCPDAKFCGYADHAPIYEVDAAAKAHLGVYGKNGLLISAAYSSFVFIAGIYTSLPAAEWENLVCGVKYPDDGDNNYEPRRCPDCGRCRSACPANAILDLGRIDTEKCLSAVTQKKKLTEADETAVAGAEYVWGCDICQLVCPYTVAAKAAGTLETPLSYFKEKLIKTLDEDTLTALAEKGQFGRRAFSWRGEETVRRNLRLHDKTDTEINDTEKDFTNNDHYLDRKTED